MTFQHWFNFAYSNHVSIFVLSFHSQWFDCWYSFFFLDVLYSDLSNCFVIYTFNFNETTTITTKIKNKWFTRSYVHCIFETILKISFTLITHAMFFGGTAQCTHTHIHEHITKNKILLLKSYFEIFFAVFKYNHDWIMKRPLKIIHTGKWQQNVFHIWMDWIESYLFGRKLPNQIYSLC